MKFGYLIEPPFNYVTPEGGVTGCDVAVARWVFADLGIEAFEPVETEFAALLPGVAAGRWRMTTGLFSTEARRKVACFSRPIWALPDGLLIARGNPLGLSGYRSVAMHGAAVLAVIRGQVQHQTALSFNVPPGRILMCDAYSEAAEAVRDGRAGAYASVALAHQGCRERHPGWEVDMVRVAVAERPPAFGAFAFALQDTALRDRVDGVLARFLCSSAHRRMVAGYGFSDADVDLVA